MSWPVRPLGEVADTALGKMLDKGRSRGLPHVPYLRNVNVQWGRIDTDNLLTMELDDAERERFGVEPGDLLVCEGGEIGRCAIWQGRSDYIAYQKALHRVRPSDALDTKFLRYLLEQYASNGILSRLSTGSTIAHLPQQQLRRIPVPLPAIDEQRRIVAILEDHLSRLDAAIASIHASLRRLEVLRRLVVKELAIGARIPLKQLAVDAGYGTSVKCEIGGPGPAVVRIPNLVGGRIDLSDEKRAADPSVDLASAMLAPGDVLVVRTNGSKDLIGRSGVVQEGVNATFASYLIRYRVDTARVRPEWIHVMLASPSLRAEIERLAASSAGQHNLSLGKLDGLLIPTPSLQDQDAGLARLAEFDDQAGALRKVLEESVRRGENLGRSLLAAAFSGRLTGSAPDMSEAEEMIGA